MHTRSAVSTRSSSPSRWRDARAFARATCSTRCRPTSSPRRSGRFTRRRAPQLRCANDLHGTGRGMPAAFILRMARSSAAEKLAKYRAMRDFAKTQEPSGEKAPESAGNSFVIQKHAARRLHYDFRLELDGVLLSWSVPKGPSLSPNEKRLAVRTEDHPLDYASFEGIIPAGEYGGGAVIVWDHGVWRPEGDPRAGLAKGRLTFELRGDKLAGSWHLVRTRGGDDKHENWLLL